MNTEERLAQKLWAYYLIFHSPWQRYHYWIWDLTEKQGLDYRGESKEIETKRMQSQLAKQLQDDLHEFNLDQAGDLNKEFKITYTYLTHGKPTGLHINFTIKRGDDCEYYLVKLHDEQNPDTALRFTLPHRFGDPVDALS